MAIDFSDPEAMRLYFAQIEDRQASLLAQIKDKDEQMKKKDEQMKKKDEQMKKKDEEMEEKDEVMEEKDEVMKEKDEVMKEKDERERKRVRRRLQEEEVASLRQEIEGSPLLKYINISGKTICTKLVVEENPKRRTTGASVTNIDGKVYPHDVKPRKGFLKELRVNFEAVCQAMESRKSPWTSPKRHLCVQYGRSKAQ
ncbi:hypothetical protein E4U47_008050 [Claviceps purpurea]|nr:hypothetical protein E4U47_008050 [Claviceps purpurea]